jgi:N-acetylmuramic acid 6-phosphate etherase
MTDTFLDPRLTERRNPRTAAIDAASPLELVDLISAEDATVPAAVAAARVEIARAIELVEAAFRSGGRLLYCGAGTSGRLGVLDASECPPTFGTDPELVQARGARTIFLSCSLPPELMRESCDVCITVLVGPEVVTGSTRMKAGTATKLVLNMLSTGAMIRLGKTWGNLMVDLRAWNDKLADRSERILMEATGIPREEAKRALQAADGTVKVAIVMLRRQVDRPEAERLLGAHAGRLRDIVGDPPPVAGA